MGIANTPRRVSFFSRISDSSDATTSSRVLDGSVHALLRIVTEKSSVYTIINMHRSVVKRDDA